MEITYSMVNDYNLPNLTMPPQPEIPLGRYAMSRKRYLEQKRKILFTNLLTSGKLTQHLVEIEHQAHEMEEHLVAQMASEQCVTEQMKTSEQMRWTGLMNNIRHSAREMVTAELITA